MGKRARGMVVRRPRRWLQECRARPRRDVRRAVDRPSADGDAQRDGVLAERQAVPPRLDAERRRARSIRWRAGSAIEPSTSCWSASTRGGGFGSKGGGAVSMAIPALLSKKAGAPVMMRISREEEHYIGRARTGMVGRARVGFAKDGRITALDLFIVEDNGPYGPMGDHRSAGNAASLIWQPPAMRWRGVACSPTRRRARSSGRRARCRRNAIMEPVVTKAAKKLGIDQVAIRRINSPEGKAPYGPPRPNGQRGPRHERVRRSRRSIAAPSSSSGTSARRAAGKRERHQGARRSASPSARTAPARSATTA